MQRKEEFIEGEFYHLYNRGNSKQLIFLDENDRQRFVKLLFLCNSKKAVNFREEIVRSKIDAFDYDRGTPIVSIGAWVLMPNHFHLLVTIPSKSPKFPKTVFGENEISVFMKKLLTSYSKYFNKKYDRVGALFEGAFKSSILNNDNYLKYIFSYIHLNPIKLIDSNWKEEGIKNIDNGINFLKNYNWSSYQEYIGSKRSQSRIISRNDFPDYFVKKKDFDKEIFDWLDYKI